MLLRRGIEEATERVVGRAAPRRARPVEGARGAARTSRRSPPRRTRSSATRSPRRWTASAPRAWSRSRSPTRPGISVEFVEGMVVENGWVSPYMVRDTERMETVFEDPLHPHDQQADQAPQRPAAGARRGHEGPAAAGHPGREGRGRARSGCWSPTTSTGTLEAVAARAPGFGHRRIQHLGDLAAFTGGVVIAEEAGLSLEQRPARALRRRAARDRAPPTRPRSSRARGTRRGRRVAAVADPRRAGARGRTSATSRSCRSGSPGCRASSP